ncbi:hypothetical protein SDC9_183923 [bioreactor metagenome]|uniref:Uncharacterized protein n=1 Tax=bioreactor metagenome TaxID=1076179 RepID=A0A645HJU3_9ZZZZ
MQCLAWLSVPAEVFMPDLAVLAHRQARYFFARPQGLALREERFFKASGVQQPGRGQADRPAARLAQVVDARPEELPADIGQVLDRQPGLRPGGVLRAKDDHARVIPVILLIEMLLVIVARHVQRLRETDAVGQFRKSQRRGHRACAVLPLHDGCQLFRDDGQAVRIGLIAVIHPFGGWLVGVIVAVIISNSGCT